MENIWQKIVDFVDSTQIVRQITEVDVSALCSNPWFIIPFICLIAYMIYKQSWKDIVLLTIFGVVWWVTGTDYMGTLLVDGEIQVSKILPVVGGGVAVLALVIFLFFGRSD